MNASSTRASSACQHVICAGPKPGREYGKLKSRRKEGLTIVDARLVEGGQVGMRPGVRAERVSTGH